MDFLDQLLADAKREAAAKPKKAKGAGVPGGDPLARENLYHPHRLVALFHRVTCARCGSVHDDFEGLFEERKHIRVSDLHMVRQPFLPISTDLPRVRKYLPRDVPYCPECAGLDSYEEET